METKILVQQIQKIEMPKEMKERIIRNCSIELQENVMPQNKNHKFFRSPVAVAAALALFLCLTGVTALAGTGQLQGLFKDIKNPLGAITGTAYEQATEEIDVRILSVSDEITLELHLLYPQDVPYRVLETIAIKKF